jgi:clan AA aspartic protease
MVSDMIRGIIVDQSPYVEVMVLGNQSQAVTIALLDTGFNSHLCLPIEIGVMLGLELRNVVEMELADGTSNLEPVYTGQVNWNGELRIVDVTLTFSDEALIGTRLLEDKSVNLDFRTGEVIIE